MQVTAIDQSKLEQILAKYEGQDGALISVLQEVQGEFGYLPKETIEQIADALKLFPSQVYGVVTFYAQFYLTPRGRNTIKICEGTACHVQGAKAVLGELKHKLGVAEGGTTDDLKFTLESVRCLGTCFLAPVVMINQDYYGKLQPRDIEDILKNYD
jgi:NADH-quinone oxidoreductase E subunit